MNDRSTICDRIRRAPNATLANALADLLTADHPHPPFLQRVGHSRALMAGGDQIIRQGDFAAMRDRLADTLDH